MSVTGTNCNDHARALLNDNAGKRYTDAVLFPYLRLSYKQLEALIRNNGSPLLQKEIAVISVPINTVSFTTAGILPADLMKPVDLHERTPGSDDDQWVPMVERRWIPSERQVEVLRFWVWESEDIKLLGSTQNREVRLHYISYLPNLADSASTLTPSDAETFVGSRTAQLAAMFVEQNESRAAAIDPLVAEARDNLLGTMVKQRQGLPARRRAYRGKRIWRAF